MHVTAKLGDPVYYSLQAQLQGGGSVTVKILVNGTVSSQSTATGGYNIASCPVTTKIAQSIRLTCGEES